jgi:hypothetical protein
VRRAQCARAPVVGNFAEGNASAASHGQVLARHVHGCAPHDLPEACSAKGDLEFRSQGPSGVFGLTVDRLAHDGVDFERLAKALALRDRALKPGNAVKDQGGRRNPEGEVAACVAASPTHDVVDIQKQASREVVLVVLCERERLELAVVPAHDIEVRVSPDSLREPIERIARCRLGRHLPRTVRPASRRAPAGMPARRAVRDADGGWLSLELPLCA